MAKEFKVTQQAATINADALVQGLSEKELMNIEFNNEYDNIARDHKLIKILWEKVQLLEQQVNELKRK